VGVKPSSKKEITENYRCGIVVNTLNESTKKVAKLLFASALFERWKLRRRMGMFKWIPANQPPKEDIFCFVARKREDSSIFITRFMGSYTTGTRQTPESPLYVGFYPQDVVYWLPIPKHFIDDQKDWIPITEEEPEESGLYIVSEYGQEVNRYNEVLKTIKGVEMVYYQAELMRFLGSPHVIAWMEIPKLKEVLNVN